MSEMRYALAPSSDRSTRHCLDPWFFVILDSRRRVWPCCWHPPVGTLPIGGSLNDMLDGHVFREIRRQLLTGELNEHCRECPVRPLTAPETFRNDLLDELAKDASQ